MSCRTLPRRCCVQYAQMTICPRQKKKKKKNGISRTRVLIIWWSGETIDRFPEKQYGRKVKTFNKFRLSLVPILTDISCLSCRCINLWYRRSDQQLTGCQNRHHVHEGYLLCFGRFLLKQNAINGLLRLN